MFLVQFGPRIPMVYFVFVYYVEKCPKIAIEKNHVIRFYIYYSHLGVKNKDIDLKFGMVST